MSEQAPEQPETSSALDPANQQQAQPEAQPTNGGEETFPIRLVKRTTGDTHWNVAKGIYETITHAETGEPTQEYALLATIGGVDVPLATYNAGGLDTIVKSQQQAQQAG